MRSNLIMAISIAIISVVPCIGCGTSDTPGETAKSSGKAVAQVTQRLERPANTKRLKRGDLVDRLIAAGLAAKDIGPAQMSMDDVSRFPEDASSSMRLRVSDGQGNSAPLTFVEFSSWQAAAKLDAKPVRGFAVRNWFVLGSVNNYFVGLLTEALAG